MRHLDGKLRVGSPSVLSSVACIFVGAMLLGSCRTSMSSSHGLVGISIPTSSTDAADGQILSAWLAAERAFHDAALTSNPDAPELAATTISPLLDNVRANLARLRSEGEIAKGPSYWGNPHITARGPGKTEVDSCVHDEAIEIVSKTGQPVPGVLGQAGFELVKSIMQSTASGWKLADQSVELGKCAGL